MAAGIDGELAQLAPKLPKMASEYLRGTTPDYYYYCCFYIAQFSACEQTHYAHAA